MKKFKSISRFLLAILFCLTLFVSCFACNSSGELPDDGGTSVDPVDLPDGTDYTPTDLYTGGIHQVSIDFSQTEFIANGTCDWQILVSSSASAKIGTAAAELAQMFYKATGSTLSVVKSDGIAYTSTAKYISLGDNDYAAAAGITKPSEIESNGYIIKTVGNSIFIVGGKDLGTLFGVYGLLNGLFDYEYYFQDSFGNECYYIDKNVSEMKLPVFDVFENPDFGHAIAGYMPMHMDTEKAHKMRMETINEVYITGTGIPYVHNTLNYLPPSRYPDHPNWYSPDGLQLCPTARGDKEEYEALIEELARVMILAIKEQPDGEIITLTQMDEGYWCECDDCRDLKMVYNTDSGSCIMLTNDVADKIEAWRVAEAPHRKITVAMFAYTATENPPVVKDANGKWQAIDEKVKLRDNVCLFFAPIYSMSWNKNVDDKANAATEDQLRGWEACADNVSVWSYASLFYNYFMPYDTYAANQNQYKRWLDAGALWIFDNAQWDTNAPLGFSTLKAYLNAVWSWDVNKNYNELVDGFFENYFGRSDGAMRKFYDELRVWLKGLDESGLGGITGNSHADWDRAKNWPKQVLTRWVDYCEDAKDEIEQLKTTDLNAYNVIINRIELEAMMPRYMLLEFHSTYFSADELTAERKSFAADCRRLGVTKVAEAKDIELLIRNW